MLENLLQAVDRTIEPLMGNLLRVRGRICEQNTEEDAEPDKILPHGPGLTMFINDYS